MDGDIDARHVRGFGAVFVQCFVRVAFQISFGTVRSSRGLEFGSEAAS